MKLVTQNELNTKYFRMKTPTYAHPEVCSEFTSPFFGGFFRACPDSFYRGQPAPSRQVETRLSCRVRQQQSLADFGLHDFSCAKGFFDPHFSLS